MPLGAERLSRDNLYAPQGSAPIGSESPGHVPHLTRSIRSMADSDAIEWLIDEGRQLLDQFGDVANADLSADFQDLGLNDKRLIETLNQQLGFRRRSVGRFPDPKKWIWTERSLSQSSDWWSAHFKARCFPTDIKVVDACCGAGVDAVAHAERNQVRAFDADPQLCMIARSNLLAHGFDSTVSDDEFSQYSFPNSAWLHLDPDRRTEGGKKSTVADDFSPPLREWLAVAKQMAGGMIKLSPATELPLAEVEGALGPCRQMWIGNRRECRQQLLIFGECREHVNSQIVDNTVLSSDDWNRVAVLAEPQTCRDDVWESVPLLAAGSEDERAAVTDDWSRVEQMSYVYDLHSTVHAAEMQASLTAAHGLKGIGARTGFFGATEKEFSPWFQCFEILRIVGWDDRKIRKTLREFDAGTVEVTKRRVKVDANAAQRRYSRPDGVPITLLVTRCGQRTKAIVARRVHDADTE